MTYEVTEVQNKNVVRVYNINGPKKESVESFWNWLVSHQVIESYSITEK
jgi:hypothetical protein